MIWEKQNNCCLIFTFKRPKKLSYYYITISLFVVKVKFSTQLIYISPNKLIFFVWLETVRLLYNNSNCLGRLRVKLNQISNQMCLPSMKQGLFQTRFAFGPLTQCPFLKYNLMLFSQSKNSSVVQFFWKGFRLWIDLNLQMYLFILIPHA